MRDSRTAVLFAHVSAMLRHTGATRDDFGDDVAQRYMARTPLHARVLQFHQHQRGANPYEVKDANGQLLFRMLDPAGPVRMAADVEEAVVLSLPQPYRDACLRELAGRVGLMATPEPAATGDVAATGMGALSTAFGEAVIAMAHTLADGQLCPADAQQAPVVVRELDDLIARATSLRAAHLAVLQDKPLTSVRTVGAA